MSDNGTFNYFNPSSSDQLWAIIYKINFVYPLAIVSLFGIIANVINICVFVRQGFGDQINISLLALAISDLGALVSALIMSACNNPSLLNSGLPVAFFQVEIIIGSVPRATFSRITNCVTTYITFERCMCVVFPMKVKEIITARVTAVTLVVIYLSLTLTLIIAYTWVSVGWRHDVFSNRTILSMTFDVNKDPDKLNSILNFQTFVQLISFALVTIFTLVLAVELRRQSRWRHGSARRNDNSSKNANRKVSKTIRMVTAMAVMYIACYSLSVGHLIFNALGPYYSLYFYDIFWIVLSVAYVMETINSSMGILMYYSMSAKYRGTFTHMFLHCWHKKNK